MQAPPPARAENAAAPAPAADTRRFDIQEYRVLGNTVLSEVDIDNAVEPFLGPDRKVSDIEAAAKALTAAYAARGYQTVSATIPPQHVAEGVVELQVIERKVGRLRVTGSRYYDLDAVKKAAPSLAEGTVPNFNNVTRDIVGLNQLPDRQVTPNLKEGRDPNTLDVDLEVKDKLPLHGSLELNNRASPSTTKLRLNGALSYDNLWQRGDAISFQFQVAPERTSDALVLSGSYLYHVPGTPITLTASYLHSNSNVSTLGTTTVVGRGDDVGLRGTIPLGSDNNGFVHTAEIGIDYKKFYEADTVSGQTTLAPLTWYPISVGYNAIWSGNGSTTNVNASVAFTLGGLGSNTNEFNNKRADATPNFIVLRGTADHTETIWHGAEVSVHATGQLSPQALIENEQFSLGGLDTVRGYPEGAALGDYGAAAQAELRSPAIPKFLGEEPTEMRGFVFFDAGATAIRNKLPGQTHSYTLASTGLGIRARVFDDFSGEVLGAVPFDDAQQTKRGNPRVLFRLTGGF
jgi:hemolysin activation/secretion protein